MSNVSQALVEYQAHAVTALEQAGLISIPLPPQDLNLLQAKAAEAGVPYQTLVAKILHQYVTGLLVEKPRGA